MQILRLPPEMITELAMGNSDPITIAKKYDYTLEDYMQIATYEWFHREVANRKSQLESEGFTTKAKMASLAEDLLVDVYAAAKLSDSINAKLDVAKYLSKIGGLEPQPGIQSVGGAGFSVTINFPTPAVGANPTTQDQQHSITIEGVSTSLDVEDAEEITRPEIREINSDLVYEEITA